MAYKVLHDSQLTLSHQGRVPGQNAGKFAERDYCGWRTLENLSFSPVHVAMVHQSLPSFESMSLRMQRKPFLCASAPQIDSFKAQEMSAMTIHLIFYLPDNLHHIQHPTSVSLANTYMKHHLSALSA